MNISSFYTNVTGTGKLLLAEHNSNLELMNGNILEAIILQRFSVFFYFPLTSKCLFRISEAPIFLRTQMGLGIMSFKHFFRSSIFGKCLQYNGKDCAYMKFLKLT